MNAKVIFSVILAANTLFCSACSNNKTNTDQNANGETAVQQTTEETPSILLPNLPEKDFGGYKFNFLTSNPFTVDLNVWNFRDIFSEEQNGDIINDAVFARNKAVEEKYNCVIGEIHAGSDFDNQFRKNVMADTADFDVFQPRMRGFGGYALDGLIIDLNTVPYLDFTKPWWDKGAVEDLTLGGKLYGVSGDINLLDNDSTTAIVFNKNMIEEFNLESPYSLVKNNKWTIDKLMEYSSSVSKDINGDSIMDYNDAYGFICQRDTLGSIFNGAGGKVAKKGEDGYPVVTLNDSKEVTVLNKVFDLMYSPYSYNVHKNLEGKIAGDWSLQMTKMFQDDRILMMWIRMRDVEAQRTMNADFGIVPVPKYDENQENYYSSVNPYVSPLICVPSSVKNLERTGIILEALAAESKYTLQPAYYDIVLNGKVARDKESSEMLDIIFSNRVYDIGDIYNFGGIGDFINMTMKDDRNIASFYAKIEKKVLADIDKTIKGFEKLE